MAVGQTRWSSSCPVWATPWGWEMCGDSHTSATEMAAVRYCNCTCNIVRYVGNGNPKKFIDRLSFLNKI